MPKIEDSIVINDKNTSKQLGDLYDLVKNLGSDGATRKYRFDFSLKGVKDLEKAKDVVEEFSKLNGKYSKKDYYVQNTTIALKEMAKAAKVVSTMGKNSYSQEFYSDMTRWGNAFLAMGGDFSKAGKEFEDAINIFNSKALKDTPYTVSAFKELFSVIDQMKNMGFDMTEISRGWARNVELPKLTTDEIIDTKKFKDAFMHMSSIVSGLYNNIKSSEKELTESKIENIVLNVSRLEEYCKMCNKDLPIFAKELKEISQYEAYPERIAEGKRISKSEISDIISELENARLPIRNIVDGVSVLVESTNDNSFEKMFSSIEKMTQDASSSTDDMVESYYKLLSVVEKLNTAFAEQRKGGVKQIGLFDELEYYTNPNDKVVGKYSVSPSDLRNANGKELNVEEIDSVIKNKISQLSDYFISALQQYESNSITENEISNKYSSFVTALSNNVKMYLDKVVGDTTLWGDASSSDIITEYLGNVLPEELNKYIESYVYSVSSFSDRKDAYNVDLIELFGTDNLEIATNSLKQVLEDMMSSLAGSDAGVFGFLPEVLDKIKWGDIAGAIERICNILKIDLTSSADAAADSVNRLTKEELALELSQKKVEKTYSDGDLSFIGKEINYDKSNGKVYEHVLMQTLEKRDEMLDTIYDLKVSDEVPDQEILDALIETYLDYLGQIEYCQKRLAEIKSQTPSEKSEGVFDSNESLGDSYDSSSVHDGIEGEKKDLESLEPILEELRRLFSDLVDTIHNFAKSFGAIDENTGLNQLTSSLLQVNNQLDVMFRKIALINKKVGKSQLVFSVKEDKSLEAEAQKELHRQDQNKRLNQLIAGYKTVVSSMEGGLTNLYSSMLSFNDEIKSSFSIKSIDDLADLYDLHSIDKISVPEDKMNRIIKFLTLVRETADSELKGITDSIDFVTKAIDEEQSRLVELKNNGASQSEISMLELSINQNVASLERYKKAQSEVIEKWSDINRVMERKSFPSLSQKYYDQKQGERFGFRGSQSPKELIQEVIDMVDNREGRMDKIDQKAVDIDLKPIQTALNAISKKLNQIVDLELSDTNPLEGIVSELGEIKTLLSSINTQFSNLNFSRVYGATNEQPEKGTSSQPRKRTQRKQTTTSNTPKLSAEVQELIDKYKILNQQVAQFANYDFSTGVYEFKAAPTGDQLTQLNQFLAVVKKLKNENVDPGKYMTEGIAEGVEQGKSVIEEEMRDAFDDAKEAFEDEAGIQSPSKELHPDGYNMSAGIAGGIEDGKSLVTDALTGVFGDAKKTISDKLESIKKFTIDDVRKKQWEIIQATNPKNEGTNSTWVDAPNDVKTYYEVAHEDRDWDFNENYTDDYTVKDKLNIEKAVLNGDKILVYSSKPIVDGNFVTPSKMEAQSYSGGAVNSAWIDPRDIAWIDVGQGQVAHLSDELKEVILLETQAKMGLIEVAKADKENVVYHSGSISRLNKAETLGMVYPGRDSGYLGTGYYFVDGAHKNELDNNSSYNSKPYTSIDISKYDNLFKANSDEVVSSLHRFLKDINNYAAGIRDYSLDDLFSKFQKVFTDSEMSMSDFSDELDKLTQYYSTRNNSEDRRDSVPTVFMKDMGYGGVDTRGTKGGNTFYGAIIYDLKEESVLQANITDELQKQGDMLEKIKYSQGEIYDSSIDENIRANIDARVKVAEMDQKLNVESSKFKGYHDWSSTRDDISNIEEELNNIYGNIYYYKNLLDNIDIAVKNHYKDMSQFGIDLSDDEINDYRTRKIKDAEESIVELEKERPLLEQKKKILSELLIIQNKMHDSAYSIVKNAVDSNTTVSADQIKEYDSQFERARNTVSQLYSKLEDVNLKLWEVQNPIDDLLDDIDLSDDIDNVGKNLVAGVEEGLKNEESDLLKTVDKVADDAIEEFKDVNGIHSPATKWIPLGENITAGITSGVLQGFYSFEDAMDFISESAMGYLKGDVVNDALMSMIKSDDYEGIAGTGLFKKLAEYSRLRDSAVQSGLSDKDAHKDSFTKIENAANGVVESVENIVEANEDVSKSSDESSNNVVSNFEEIQKSANNAAESVERVSTSIDDLLEGARQNGTFELIDDETLEELEKQIPYAIRQIGLASDGVYSFTQKMGEYQTRQVTMAYAKDENGNLEKNAKGEYYFKTNFSPLQTNFEGLKKALIDTDTAIIKIEDDISKLEAQRVDTSGLVNNLKILEAQRKNLEKERDKYVYSQVMDLNGKPIDNYKARLSQFEEARKVNESKVRAGLFTKDQVSDMREYDKLARDLTNTMGKLDKFDLDTKALQNLYDVNQNAKKPITNAQDLAELEKRRLAILDKINTIRNSGLAITDQERADIAYEIKDLKLLIQQYQNKEYVATAMSPADLQSNKSKLLSSADALIAKAKIAGSYTSGLVANVESLKVGIKKISDSADIKKYYDAIQVKNADLKALNMQEKERVNSFNTQVSSINALVKAQETLNVTRSKDAGNDKSYLDEISAKEKDVKDKALTAKKAMVELFKMFKKGSISQEEFDSAFTLYKNAKSNNVSNKYRVSDSQFNASSKELMQLSTSMESAEKNAKKYFDLLKKSKADKTWIDEDSALKKLIEDFNEAISAKQKYENIDVSTLSASAESKNRYINASNSFDPNVLFKGYIKSFSDSIYDFVGNLNNEGVSTKYIQAFNDKLLNISSLTDKLKKGNYDIFDVDQLNEALDLINSIENVQKEINTARDKNNKSDWLAINESQVKKPMEEIARTINKNGAMADELRQKFLDLKDRYENVFTSGKPVSALRDLDDELARLKYELQNSGKIGKSFAQNIGEQIKHSYAQLFATYFSIQDWIRYARSAFSVIQELDTALVDLKKTAQMSNQQLDEFYYTSNNIAKQMGVTTQEIIEQAAAWSRLGYSTKEEVETMAQLSSQFASISPGMDTTTAQEGLVSAMKGFGIATEDVERQIMDNINKIGNTMATSNADIVDMLERSSAAMAAANNTIEETIALEAAAVEVTQNAENTGTAFRTISMRIRGYDEETEELSEDLETIAGDIADLTRIDGKGGVSLFTDETKETYKSTYQILKDISEIYDQLTDKQQAQLLEKLGGKRGGQVIASVLTPEGFKRASDALKTMEEAGGSADAEMGIIQESIDYKLNALQQTWVGIAQDIIQRDDIGKLIDYFRELSDILSEDSDSIGQFVSDLGLILEPIGELLKLLTLLASKIGILPTIFGGIGLVAGFKGNGFSVDKISGSISSLLYSLKELKGIDLSSIFSKFNAENSFDLSSAYSQNGHLTFAARELTWEDFVPDLSEGENVVEQFYANLDTTQKGWADKAAEYYIQLSDAEKEEFNNLQSLTKSQKAAVINRFDELQNSLSADSVWEDYDNGVNDAIESTSIFADELKDAFPTDSTFSNEWLDGVHNALVETNDDIAEMSGEIRETLSDVFVAPDSNFDEMTTGVIEGADEFQEALSGAFEEYTADAENLGETLTGTLQDVMTGSTDAVGTLTGALEGNSVAEQTNANATRTNSSTKAEAIALANQECNSVMAQAVAESSLTAEQQANTMAKWNEIAAEGELTATRLKAIAALSADELGLDADSAAVVRNTALKLANAKASKLATLANSLLTMGIYALGSIAINWVLTKIDDFIHKEEKMAEAAEEALSAIKSLNDEFKSSKDKVDDIKESYAELAQGVANVGTMFQNQGSLSNEEYEQFLDYSNQLAELYPELTKGYNDNGDAILDLSGNVDTIVSSLDNLIDRQKRLANQEILENMPKVFDNYVSKVESYYNNPGSFEDIDDYKRRIEQYKAVYNGLLNGEIISTYNESQVKEMLDATREVLGNVDALYEKNGRLNYDTYNTYSDIDGDGFYDLDFSSLYLSDEDKQAIERYYRSAILEFESEISNMENKVQNLNSDLVDGINAQLETDFAYSALSNTQQDVVKEIVSGLNYHDIISELDDQSWDGLTDYINEHIVQVIGKINSEAIQEKIVDLMTVDYSYEDFKTAYDSILKYLQEQVETGVITQADYDNIVHVYFEPKLEEVENQKNDFMNRIFDQSGGFQKLGYRIFGNSDPVYKAISDYYDGLDAASRADFGNIHIDYEDILKADDAQEYLNQLLEDYRKEVRSINDDIDASISDSVKQLANEMTPFFNELEESYKNIFTADGFTRENIDNDMLEGIRSTFEDIDSELGISFDSKYIDDFIDVLTDSEKSADDVQQAYNDLATQWLYSTETLNNLNEETRESIELQLKQMGITNSDEIVEGAMSYKEYSEALELYSYNLQRANETKEQESAYYRKTAQEIYDEISAHYDEATATEYERQAMAALSLERMYYNSNGIDNSEECREFVELASRLGQDCILYQNLIELEELWNEYEGNAGKISAKRAENIMARINEIQAEIQGDFSNLSDYLTVPEIPATVHWDNDASDAGKDAADEYNEAFQNELDNLQFLRDNNFITEKEYLDQYRDLIERYYGDIEDDTADFIDTTNEELSRLGEGGNVNLNLRPVIDASDLKNVGWENAGDGVATVYSSTYSNAAGDIAMNFTPIIADPNTGEYLGVLSPEELQAYAEGVISGVRKDDLNLQIGCAFTGKDAIQQAEIAAETIHNLHEQEIKQASHSKEYYENLKELLEGLKSLYESASSAAQSAIQDEIDALNDKKDAEVKVYDTQIKSIDKVIEKLNEEIDGYKEQQDAIQDLIDDIQDIIDEYEDQKDAIQDLIDEQQEYIDNIDEQIEAIDKLIKPLDKQIKAYEKEQKAIDKLAEPLKDQIEAYEDEKEAIDKLIKPLNKQIKAYQKQQDALDDLIKPLDKQIDALNDELDALNEANDARQKAIDLQKDQYELERAQNQRSKLVKIHANYKDNYIG